MSEYTQYMRRLDHERLRSLVKRQEELLKQLHAVSQEILTQAGKTHDHAAGFRHTPDSCLCCAAEEPRTP